MFNEMYIDQVNLPNNECFMIQSITNCLKNTLPLQKYHLNHGDFFQLHFIHTNSIFEDKHGMKWNAWHQAAENSLTTSGAAKKELFSLSENCSCWSLNQFERTSYVTVTLHRQKDKLPNSCTNPAYLFKIRNIIS